MFSTPVFFHIHLNVLQTYSCTLAHATSWEVDRAHWVAAAMTRFWSTVSSATWATFLAFSTNMAAALATALARFIRMSYNNNNRWQRWGKKTHTQTNNNLISNIIHLHSLSYFHIFISFSWTDEKYCGIGIWIVQIKVKLLFSAALCYRVMSVVVCNCAEREDIRNLKHFTEIGHLTAISFHF